MTLDRNQNAQIGEITREGVDKHKRWLDAKEAVDRAKDRLNSVETGLLNATIQFGKWMVPSDAKANEEFCIWVGDALYVVKVLDTSGDGTYVIHKRNRKS